MIPRLFSSHVSFTAQFLVAFYVSISYCLSLFPISILPLHVVSLYLLWCYSSTIGVEDLYPLLLFWLLYTKDLYVPVLCNTRLPYISWLVSYSFSPILLHFELSSSIVTMCPNHFSCCVLTLLVILVIFSLLIISSVSLCIWNKCYSQVKRENFNRRNVIKKQRNEYVKKGNNT